jgi:hypothetical protein
MRTVEELEISYTQFPEPERQPSLFQKLGRNKLLFLAITFLLALSLRVYKLDAAGLSEDETNKVFALRAYAQGDFTVNAEHPMLMKLLCYASTRSATFWNHNIGNRLNFTISEESALRFPNVLFGALTVIPLFLLVTALMGFEIGAITTLLWTFGLNAIWFNRITKEDTLLLFFVLLGFYFYNRAKTCDEYDIAGQEKYYALAGAAFGLMICSKYFPHFVGLNALFYTIIGYDSRTNRPLTKRMWGKYFGAMVLAFIVCNAAIFSPQTMRYVWAYLNEDLLTHHGYVVMGRLFNNDMVDTPFGNPAYFYWLYLAVKVPLPILLAFLVGLVEIFRHRGEPRVARGYLFLRMMLVFWLLPMSFIGSKFLRYSLTLMPLVYATAAIGILVIGRLLARVWQRSSSPYTNTPQWTQVVVILFFVGAPASTTVLWGLPYQGLYTNALGGGRVGYFFPHDEFYDVGARESIRYIAENASPNATVISEIPGVVQYYLERYQRPDLRSEIMSQPDFALGKDHLNYAILQRGRVYFENEQDFRYIENRFPRVQSSLFKGAAASEVFRFEQEAATANLTPNTP